MATAARRLKNARKKRSRIASTLKRLRDDQLNVADVLESPPRYLGSVRIHVLLENTHNLGEAGVKKVLEKSKVYAAARLAQLEDEELQRIIRNLPPRAR